MARKFSEKSIFFNIKDEVIKYNGFLTKVTQPKGKGLKRSIFEHLEEQYQTFLILYKCYLQSYSKGDVDVDIYRMHCAIPGCRFEI